MQVLYYSVIGMLAIIIHLLLNYKMFAKPNKHDDSIKIPYRFFLISVLAYFVSDVLWGILDYSGNTKLLYADTILYYITMASSAVLALLILNFFTPLL